MTRQPTNTFDADYERWLNQIVSLREGAELRGVSVDTLKRHSPDRLIQVSARRLGMRRRHALLMED